MSLSFAQCRTCLVRPVRDEPSVWQQWLWKWDELLEAALFEGSSGIYVVPPQGNAPDAFRRILIAWKDTRQTARAVAEAMPLIEKATRTAVVLVDADRGYVDEKREPGAPTWRATSTGMAPRWRSSLSRVPEGRWPKSSFRRDQLP